MDFFSYFSFIARQIFYKIKHYFKKNLKFIIIFSALVLFFFIQNTCFAATATYPYDSNHYIEWYDTNYNNTIRVSAGVDFMLVPNKYNPIAMNAYNIYTGEIINVSEYYNGNFVRDYYGSYFLTNEGFYGKTPQLITKGRYIAFTYDTNLNSYYEFSSNCPPFIYNLQDTINWSFTDLQICFGDTMTIYTHPERWRITLIVQHNGQNYSYNINNYLSTITYKSSPNAQNQFTYDFKYDKAEVPKYSILQDVILKSNDVIRFSIKTEYSTDNFTNNIITDYYNLGSINYGASANDEINNNLSVIDNSLKNIDNSVQETTQAVEQTTQAVEDNTQAVEDNTQAVEHLEDTITDPTVDDDSLDLPTIDVANPAQQGIENLFINLYNAFCTNTTTDIVIPVPYTNQSFTIPYNLTYDALHNNGGDILIAIITAFWWYKLGGWVVFDIYDKIIKIQEGDAEEVQTSNISKDML